ncbi:MAG: alginate lyase family protein [Candidatus Hodarchaeota archaeon]
MPYSIIEDRLSIIEYLKENCKKSIDKYLASANKVIQKDFSIFEKKYRFKNDIDWHYTFFKDISWNLDYFKDIKINPKDIDVKYVWELNRHQFLAYLGFAYYYTKNEKYAKEFKSIILNWIQKNPPLFGINWYSGLEIAIRLTSWIFSLLFFKESMEINNSIFFKTILKSMYQHAYFLRQFYIRRSYNHTVGELFGLYLFSKVFEDIKPIKKWEQKFFKIFKKQLYLQVRTDGTNIEQSLNYHKFVLEFFTLFLILTQNTVNKTEEETIEKMFNYLLYSVKPSGKYPVIGDSDDAKVLFLSDNTLNSFNELINLGCILFEREDLKFISKELSPISILLLGLNGSKLYNKLNITEPKKKFAYFKDAGYFIIRNDWSDKANYLFVDYGRFGPSDAGHSHSSITNFIFSYKGNEILIDSGTFSYNKSLKKRNLYRSSKSHNILTINQKNQAEMISRFRWKNKPKIKRIIDIRENEIHLTCYHNGYEGFTVKRKISSTKELDKIIIQDVVIKTNNSDVARWDNIYINFNFNPNLELKIKEKMIFINSDLCFKISSKNKFTISKEESYFSPSYGSELRNPQIVVKFKNISRKNKRFEVLTKIESLN